MQSIANASKIIAESFMIIDEISVIDDVIEVFICFRMVILEDGGCMINHNFQTSPTVAAGPPTSHPRVGGISLERKYHPPPPPSLLS